MKGWAYKKINEIGKVQTGSTPQTADKANYGDHIPFIKPGDFLKDGSLTYKNQGLSEQGLRNARLVERDSVLMVCIGATIGKVGFTEQEVVTNQQINTLTPLHGDSAKFIFYQMLTQDFQQKVLSGAGQATLPIINKKKWSNLSLHLPHPLEQKRIVAIVDNAFEGIDRAIANTEKNLTNARELFESYLNAIFTRKGDGWVEKKLSEIGGKVFTGPFGSLLHKSDYISNGIPIVNPANIEDGEIIPNFNKTVSQDVIVRLKAYVLSENDIVIGRRGEIGRCAVVRKEQAGWLCGSGSFFIKTFENVDSVFLTHLFRSAQYRNQLESLSAGATMQNLSNQALAGLLIAMPPLDEQNRITDKLDDLKAETQRLEAIYQQKLVSLNELKQAILQKAFTGELTADTANQTTKAAEEVIAA
ncbi:MAG: restriction endonuclease subunit S (plasmid) [Stenomitos frigidus ULC029]